MALFRALFDDDVAVAEMDPRDADPAELTPDELALVSGAIEGRQREFAAGRLMAKRLLGQLGMTTEFSLLRGEQREPCWPPGFVGSITHKPTVAAVAVADATIVRSLGCDVEQDEPLLAGLWRRVLTADEQRWLEAQHSSWQLAKLHFSAKECFYKAQFPLTRTWLGFLDVQLRVEPGADPTAGVFFVELLRDIPALAGDSSLSGRYVIRNGCIATAMTLR